MKYITQPPKNTNTNYPSFMQFYYSNKFPITLEYILKLIKWAEQEFADWHSRLVVNRDKEGIKKFRKLSCLHLLASTEEFANIVKNMDQDVWNGLPNAVRKTLVNTHDIYSSLGA